MALLNSNGQLTYLICSSSIVEALETIWAKLDPEQQAELTETWYDDVKTYVNGGTYETAELAAKNFNGCSVYDMCSQVNLA